MSRCVVMLMCWFVVNVGMLECWCVDVFVCRYVVVLVCFVLV